jgi:hypothetical protein
MADYYENRMKRINKICRKNSELLNLKVGCMYSYHRSLKG